MTAPVSHPTLILCIGNTLRRDDGAAWVTAKMLEETGGVEAEIVCVFQLLPEHAELMSRYDRVIVVDASVAAREDVRISMIEPNMSGETDLHRFDLGGVLAMAAALYGHAPHCSLCEIPAFDMNYGEGLSEQTTAFALRAGHMLREVLASK